MTLVFPNIDLKIKFKGPLKDVYDIDEILCILSMIRRYELGGEYKIGKGFFIDINITYYDYDSDRPYTTLDLTNGGILWHSHPFGMRIENAYPSIEDMQIARDNKDIIFMIITGRGLYIISTIKDISGEDVVEFYDSMECDDIESAFVNYKFTEEIVESTGIFLSCIPLSLISLDLIDKTISHIKKLKSNIEKN